MSLVGTHTTVSATHVCASIAHAQVQSDKTFLGGTFGTAVESCSATYVRMTVELDTRQRRQDLYPTSTELIRAFSSQASKDPEPPRMGEARGPGPGPTTNTGARQDSYPSERDLTSRPGGEPETSHGGPPKLFVHNPQNRPFELLFF